MKRFISIATLFFFFILNTRGVFAQGTNSPPTPSTDCAIYENYSVCPGEVNDGIFHVKLVFTGLSSTTGAYYCLKTNPKDCSDDDLNSVGGDSTSQVVGGDIVFPCLAGKGDKELKYSCANDGSDWFHSGKTYRVTLYDKKKAKDSNIIRSGAFYIRHFYPTVVEPKANLYPTKESTVRPDLNLKGRSELPLTLTLSGRNKKGGGDSNKYNDYRVQVFSRDSDYKAGGKNTCIYVGPDGQGNLTISLPSQISGDDGSFIPLTSGNYVLRIKDGKNGNYQIGNAATCDQNDFTYYDIPFTIGNGSDGSIGPIFKDPYGKETGTKGVNPTPPPVCITGDRDKNGYCTSIQTALGIKIHTEPRAFVGDIFRIVLSIGGIVAFLFFIQAGYTLMTSSGNKEKVAAAREQITAAIMGLLFIILSLAILEFIGIDILRIPGFTR